VAVPTTSVVEREVNGRITFERPLPSRGCAELDCDASSLASTDVYCIDHQTPIPLLGRMQSRSDWVVLNLGRIALLGAFPLAAQTESQLPLQVLFIVVGGIVLAMHLFRYPATRRFEMIALGLFGLVFLSSGDIPMWWRTLVFSTIAAIVFVAWAVGAHSKIVELQPSSGPSVKRAAAHFATAAMIGGTAVALMWLFLDKAPDALALAEGRHERSWLLFVAAGGWATVFAACVVGGLLDSGTRIERDEAEPWSIRELHRTWSITIVRPHRRREADVIERSAFAVRMLFFRVFVAVARTVEATFDVALRAGLVAVRAAVCAVYYIQRELQLALRRLVACLAVSGRIALRALELFARTGAAAARSILAPAIALGGAAALLVSAGQPELNFLVDSAWSSLGMVIVLAFAAFMLLTVAWVLAVAEDPLTALRSATRTAGLAAPGLLLFLALGGWLVGLPGTFGHGRIHVGAITLAATIALAGAYAWTRHRQPGDQEAARVPGDVTPLEQTA
jgi:hypothetical protein